MKSYLGSYWLLCSVVGLLVCAGAGVCLWFWPVGTILALVGLAPVPLVVLAVAGAAASDRKKREFARERERLCASCGYDRRGLVGDVPCPECGRRL